MAAAARGSGMRRIPVLETVGVAVTFVASRLPRIVLVSIVPLAIVAAGTLFLQWKMFDHMVEMIEGRATDAMPRWFLPAWIAQTVVSVVAYSFVAVAFHRMALLGHDAIPRSDATSWRFVLAMICVGLVGTVLYLIAMLVLFPVISKASHGMNFGVFAAGGIGALLLAMRFAPVFPGLVATGRIDFGRAWALTRGNLLRLCAVYLMVFVPVALVAFTLDPIMTPRALRMQPTNPSEVRTYLAAARDALPIFTIVNLLWDILYTALGVGVLSTSYKALVGAPLEEPLFKSSLMENGTEG